MAWPSSCGARTTRIPRPPPPAVAFTITGKPCVVANFSASSSLAIGPSVPGSSGSPAFFMARRARLVAHQPDHFRIGPDEADVARFAHFGQIRRLGEEPVAGVDRIGAGNFRGADDGRHVQVAVGAARRADAHVLIGKPHVQGILVGLRVDGDRLDTELAAGDDDPHRNLAAVGNQNFLKHRSVLLSRTNAPRTARAARSRRKHSRPHRHTPNRSRSSASSPR